MQAPFPAYIGPDAPAHVVRFCRERGYSRLTLVDDEHTHRALGARALRALQEGALQVRTITLAGGEVLADARRILEVLVVAGEDAAPDAYVAVGSGTVTDIVRFVSHRTGVGFISLPTAPSVDGYASVSAALVIERFKKTVLAQGPLAIYADLPTLCDAPQRMVAAGFGDMLGKYASLADWRLSQLVWGDRYDDDVAAQTRGALEACVQAADAIGERDDTGVRALMEGLVESGLAMRRFGDSRPASGAEHHLSHYWEMRLLLEDRPALLHGAKVGVAAVRVARRYAQVRGMTREEAARRLEALPAPAYEAEVAAIRDGYGPAAEAIIAFHRAFLEVDAAAHRALCEKVLARWDDIQAAAREVPAPEALADLLRRVGGPTTVAELGLSEQEGQDAERLAHYLRPRFTILKLVRMLGLL